MPQPFNTVTGVGAPFPLANIDTDVIMPKQFLKILGREGLAHGTFHDLRFDEREEPQPDFVLNRAPYSSAVFLVTGPNFGCGSSREHAVWGLLQLGIRAVIGASFAGIFRDNCFSNGLLPVTLGDADAGWLLETVADPTTSTLTVDLPRQTVEAAGRTLAFEIEPLRKTNLLKGLDVISATLQYAASIRQFERMRTGT